MKHAFVALSLAVVALSAPALADIDLEGQVQQNKLRQVVERAQTAYVFIGGGSGAIISRDGLVITNNHVAGSAKTWKVKTAAGKSYIADVVGLAPQTDLALLKIRDARNLPFLAIGDSDRLIDGQQVIAIGNPFGLGNMDHIPTVTLGIVSAVGISGPNAGDIIVTDAPTNPGNSGGPLINLLGELVGINYAQMPSRFGIKINTGSGYAISANQLKRFLPALKVAKGGKVDIGWINGVKFDWAAATQPDDQSNAIVREVEPSSVAGRAGLLPGDRVVSLGPWSVLSLGQLHSLAARFPAGADATVAVQRDRVRQELTLRLSARERVGLGVVFESASKNSLRVERVVPNSPAHLAGIRPGDVIRAVGRAALPTRQALRTLLANGLPGQTAQLVVSRAGRQMPVKLELASESELARLVKDAKDLPEVGPPGPDDLPPAATQPEDSLLPPLPATQPEDEE